MKHRAHGRCVLCDAVAVDAHHVLDRKLYPDGGYYLGNGAAVCSTRGLRHRYCLPISVQSTSTTNGATVVRSMVCANPGP